MDAEKKPDLSLLPPVTRTRAASRQKVASLENSQTVGFRDWMNNKGTICQQSTQSIPLREEQSYVKLPSLPSSSPTPPQNQTGQLVIIKDEPWKGPTGLSYDKALISAAEDWIGPSKISDNKFQTHPAPDEVKLMLPFSNANQNPYNEAPPLRPTPQPNPVPTTNTVRLQLPNIYPTQIQGLKLFPTTTIPTMPRSGLKRKARGDEQSRTSNGNMIKKPADNLLCNLCQISCSGAVTMQQHLKGRPHKAKMEYMKLKKSCTTTRGRQGTPRCDACEIWCPDPASLEMHYKGQKHKAKLQELQLRKQRGGQKLSKAPVICDLCCVPCMNQDLYEMHLKGRQHATKVELRRRGFH